MGYWSYHPMGGDAPLDYVSLMDSFIIKSKGYESLSDYAEKEYNLESFYEIPSKFIKELYEEYKYFLIDKAVNEHNFLAEEYFKTEEIGLEFINGGESRIIHNKNKYNKRIYNSYKFVIPFKFIEYGIRVNEEFINDLVVLLGDGGAKEREYEVNDNSELKFDNPYDYVRFAKQHADILFNEKYKNEDVPEEIYQQLECDGLLMTILKEGGFGLVNKD